MADTDSSVLPKGSDVWYLHRSGAWQQARVTAVDETMLPAFYQVFHSPLVHIDAIRSIGVV